jgi:hypothetical protein
MLLSGQAGGRRGHASDARAEASDRPAAVLASLPGVQEEPGRRGCHGPGPPRSAGRWRRLAVGRGVIVPGVGAADDAGQTSVGVGDGQRSDVVAASSLTGAKVLMRPRNGPAALPARQKARHAGPAGRRPGNRQARRGGAPGRGRASLARTASSGAARCSPSAPKRRARRAASPPQERSAPGPAPDLSSSSLTPGPDPASASFTGAQPGHARQGQTAPLNPAQLAHHRGCEGDGSPRHRGHSAVTILANGAKH